MNITIELILALAAFAVVSSITPGPNNFMMMASGANFGFKRSMPHWFGVDIGFTLMIALVGLGVMQLFELFPTSLIILKWVCGAYVFYLAYKIATSTDSVEDDNSQAKPMTFLQAAAFQWVNPKAWTMALSAITIYAPSQDLSSVLLVSSVFCVVSFPCTAAWIFVGKNIKSVLASTRSLKIFNYLMAVLLVLSLFPTI